MKTQYLKIKYLFLHDVLRVPRLFLKLNKTKNALKNALIVPHRNNATELTATSSFTNEELELFNTLTIS